MVYYYLAINLHYTMTFRTSWESIALNVRTDHVTQGWHGNEVFSKMFVICVNTYIKVRSITLKV